MKGLTLYRFNINKSFPWASKMCRYTSNPLHSAVSVSISLWDLYGGFNTRHYTLVHGFCFLKLFSVGCIASVNRISTPYITCRIKFK